ncbi:hypothetical protein ALDI51_32460 [Alicycliphilus denitrificans]|uniref:DUF4124 domain-containing protein n=1 Tax=Alicycliphilus denitrificans TaxID=179636 RepID=UPI001F3F09D1|nr:DUF4124 domain-containing protein [Alicycliphilus denitrificans]BCN39927.1 hypothetical protein ALDI51_32460 [Alicycliphilus denitrificans]
MYRASSCFVFAFLYMVSVPLGAFAQVYKCTDKSGNVVYADSPCDPRDAGIVIEQKKTPEEIESERNSAAEAMSRKHRERAIGNEGAKFEAQATQPALAQSSGNSVACREARKELEFVSSIRTISQDEKRMRVNAGIAQVNAACGTTMPLMQEPDKAVVPHGHRVYRGDKSK